jgi:hypothetical protein
VSAIKPQLIWSIGALCFLIAGSILPNKARGEFSSPFDAGGPTSREADQLLEGHPSCGALILYSIIASQHPQLLLDNLETADVMADALTADHHDYDKMTQAFRVIALHLSEHDDNAQSQTVEYWRRACDDMERCANEAVSSPACNSARSAIENFDY